VSPRNSTRSGDAGSKHSSSPNHSSPLQKEVTNISLSNTPNLNPNPKENEVDVKNEGAARPASLGGRSTVDSMPVHKQSLGFRGGGERGITKVDEENEAGN
jgi:hypothetical protein